VNCGPEQDLSLSDPQACAVVCTRAPVARLLPEIRVPGWLGTVGGWSVLLAETPLKRFVSPWRRPGGRLVKGGAPVWTVVLLASGYLMVAVESDTEVARMEWALGWTPPADPVERAGHRRQWQEEAARMARIAGMPQAAVEISQVCHEPGSGGTRPCLDELASRVIDIAGLPADLLKLTGPSAAQLLQGAQRVPVASLVASPVGRSVASSGGLTVASPVAPSGASPVVSSGGLSGGLSGRQRGRENPE
jgi:hypothetical protein